MIRQVSFREEKIYSPRKTNGKIVEGVVRELEEGYREPETIIDDVRKLIAKGKAVMLLTTCAYMLDPIKRELKKKGLPFWNPYRKERGDWNPLRGGSTTNTSKDMVLNFLSSGEDVNYWDRTRRQLDDSKTKIQTQDELYRLFYVGMTRAKEELVLMKYSLQKGRPYYVDLYANKKAGT
jgi:superfamily I DNA/RNA helicase